MNLENISSENNELENSPIPPTTDEFTDEVKIVKEEHEEMGKVIRLEGELMEISVGNPSLYNIGDFIKCYYNDRKFDTRILRIYENKMYLFISISGEDFEGNRRNIPRVKKQIMAKINDYSSEKILNFKPRTPIEIVDLSIKGFGFFSEKKCCNVNEIYYLHFEIDNSPIVVKVEILNEREMDKKFRYGCIIKHINKESFHILRKFVLLEQLQIMK